MNIAIDATIIKKEITGTGFYIINLIAGLMRIDVSNHYFIFADEDCLKEFIKIDKDNFQVINKKFKNRIIRVLWEYFVFAFNLKKLKVDILHSPNYITPLFKLGFKVILTIHDLTFLLFPEKHTITKRFLFGKMMRFYIKVADKIIADSENTKKDILRFFNINEDKIAVSYVSYPDYYHPCIDMLEAKEVLKKYSIKKDFLLYVGMIEPRKNIIAIIKAFIDIEDDLDADLVIVGKKGWYYQEIEKAMSEIKKMNIKNHIIFTGYVPEEDLKYFYKTAIFFVYPSIYEGFGLPPLQSMACGTPVITSNISSLPEVVGDAAIKIDPDDLERLKEAMRLLYNDKEKRNELVEKGIKRSKNFSLENIASNVLYSYKDLQIRE